LPQRQAWTSTRWAGCERSATRSTLECELLDPDRAIGQQGKLHLVAVAGEAWQHAVDLTENVDSLLTRLATVMQSRGLCQAGHHVRSPAIPFPCSTGFGLRDAVAGGDSGGWLDFLSYSRSRGAQRHHARRPRQFDAEVKPAPRVTAPVLEQTLAAARRPGC
jgi:hypothetical protein